MKPGTPRETEKFQVSTQPVREVQILGDYAFFRTEDVHAAMRLDGTDFRRLYDEFFGE